MLRSKVIVEECAGFVAMRFAMQPRVGVAGAVWVYDGMSLKAAVSRLQGLPDLPQVLHVNAYQIQEASM